MKLFKLKACLLVAVFCCASALAHKPLLSVDDNEDGTIYIEVGFSDGSSGAGHDIILKDKSGEVLNELKVPDESSVDVGMPAVPYTVTFSAGEGHVVTIDGPFSDQVVTAEEETPAKKEAPAKEEASTAKVTPVAPPPQPTSHQAVQPVVSAPQVPQVTQETSLGFNMALKMMITTNIIVAVFVAFLLSLCSFWIGYSISKSKK